jgi:integrase
VSALAAQRVGFEAHLRDLRHMEALAASDLADWLVHLDLEGKADRTLYAYTRQIAPLLRAHPHKTIAEFTHTDINDRLRLIPQRSRHISRSIYNKFFEWAEEDERIDRSPMNRVPKMRQPSRRPKDIFSEEEIALLEGLPTPDGELWAILFGTGIRRGEARALRRSHINLNREHLIVYHGKGNKDRIVGLPLRVRVAVADLDLLEGLGKDSFLWYTTPGGGRRRSRANEMGDTTFEHWYKRGIRDADVRYLNPHQTRHTYGHWLRERGLDLEERQRAMGHESSSTTERYYGRVTMEDVARKVAQL